MLLYLICSLFLCTVAINDRSFEIENNRFVKDGQEILLLSGEIHYSRIHPSSWRDRLIRMKSMGLNSAQIYVPWNFHQENKEGGFNFKRDRDIHKFIEICGELDLLVLLRAGPYMCGEWELGGLPAFLLNEPNITLRTYNEPYINYVDNYFSNLFPLLKDLLYENGGPIVMIQIENEFGSYGNVEENELDRKYMEHLLQQVRYYFGENVIVYTTDGGNEDYMRRGTIPGKVLTIGDFGPGSNPADSFAAQRKFNLPGKSVNMCSEFYTGWLTHWGEQMANTSTAAIIKTLDEIISLNGSVSFYMAHGGSNFGFWSGANGALKDYQPHITSYDYDSPISEGGNHGYGADGDKYFAIRNYLSKFGKQIDEPQPIRTFAYGKVFFDKYADFFGNVDLLSQYNEAIYSDTPMNMEFYKQNYGFILFSATLESLNENGENILTMNSYVRDRVQVFVDDVFQGVIYRRDEIQGLNITASNGQRIFLLVENMGRINFSVGLFDQKGIVGGLKLNGVELNGEKMWRAVCLPLFDDNVKKIQYDSLSTSFVQKNRPLFFKSIFHIDAVTDTFVGMYNWSKGIVFINNVNIGRYWQTEGPQNTLYIPAALLHKGQNKIVIFELESHNPDLSVEFVSQHDFHHSSAKIVNPNFRKVELF